MKDVGLGNLRRFARDIDKLPRVVGDNSQKTAKGYYSEDLAKIGLTEKYPFLTWLKAGSKYEGPSHIYEENDVVDVRWGGTLSGYWGFSVAVDGRKIVSSNKSDQILRVSDDIYFIYEGD